MSFQSSDLTASQLEFIRENHLATLTTLRADGSPHVVPVGFTFEGTVRLRNEADIVAKAVEAYAGRYRQPKVREDRVVVEITVDKVMGRA
jgi:predicted pyridoxine 5'-phosphate oxidase superfamily flavin-nucleotide-binding protein